LSNGTLWSKNLVR